MRIAIIINRISILNSFNSVQNNHHGRKVRSIMLPNWIDHRLKRLRDWWVTGRNLYIFVPKGSWFSKNIFLKVFLCLLVTIKTPNGMGWSLDLVRWASVTVSNLGKLMKFVRSCWFKNQKCTGEERLLLPNA